MKIYLSLWETNDVYLLSSMFSFLSVTVVAIVWRQGLMYSRPASTLTSLAKDGLDYLILFLPPPFLSAATTGMCHHTRFMKYKGSSIALCTC